MIRCLFILTNTLAFLGGTALIGLCAWIIVDAEAIGIEANGILDWILEEIQKIYNQLGENFEIDVEIPEIFNEIFEWIGYATYIALAAGCLVAIISFTGCYGAQANSKCLLTIFEIFMALLIVIQIAAAVLAIFYYPLIDEFLVERFAEYKTIPKPEDILYLDEIPEPDDLFNSQFVDTLQTTFDCCGWNSKHDFTTETLPDSCYANQNRTDLNLFDASCESQIESYLVIIGAVGGAIVAFELVSLIVSCFVKSGIEKRA